MNLELLVPQLIPPLNALVIKFFDDYDYGTLKCVTQDLGCKDADEFQTKIVPMMKRRHFDDDDELFLGCSHSSGIYNMFLEPDAINSVLGQLYRAGLSFFPGTVHRIASSGGALATWLARDFFLDLGMPLLTLKHEYMFTKPNQKDFYAAVFKNIGSFRKKTEGIQKHTAATHTDNDTDTQNQKRTRICIDNTVH